MIEYSTDVSHVTEEDLAPFFVGWDPAPSPAHRLRSLRAASAAVLARDGARLIGFVTAISDEVDTTYISLLEVLPEYQHGGIGTELMRRIVDRYRHLYGVDLCCDPRLVPFYERLGMRRMAGMVLRNPAALGGG